MNSVRVIGLLLLGVIAAPTADAGTVNAAVASNFTAAMNELVERFEASSGHRVILSFGSSGKLYAQIRHGAPFQVFFSADRAKPDALERGGLAVPDSRFTYAVGALALWSSRPGFVDDGATVLKGGNFNKLALANPRLAPYGTAAVEVLDSLELKETTRAKWVRGENIAQTYQFVRTGNADVGFVALSQITDKGGLREGSAWIVPAEHHNPIRQDAVLLHYGEGSDATRALLRFVRSKTARRIIASHGYTTPPIRP